MLFPIGMFPWIMIASTLIFFGYDWPDRVLGALGRRTAPLGIAPADRPRTGARSARGSRAARCGRPDRAAAAAPRLPGRRALDRGGLLPQLAGDAHGEGRHRRLRGDRPVIRADTGGQGRSSCSPTGRPNRRRSGRISSTRRPTSWPMTSRVAASRMSRFGPTPGSRSTAGGPNGSSIRRSTLPPSSGAGDTSVGSSPSGHQKCRPPRGRRL